MRISYRLYTHETDDNGQALLSDFLKGERDPNAPISAEILLAKGVSDASAWVSFQELPKMLALGWLQDPKHADLRTGSVRIWCSSMPSKSLEPVPF
jgi:hypothetical protein